MSFSLSLVAVGAKLNFPCSDNPGKLQWLLRGRLVVQAEAHHSLRDRYPPNQRVSLARPLACAILSLQLAHHCPSAPTSKIQVEITGDRQEVSRSMDAARIVRLYPPLHYELERQTTTTTEPRHMIVVPPYSFPFSYWRVLAHVKQMIEVWYNQTYANDLFAPFWRCPARPPITISTLSIPQLHSLESFAF